MTMLTNKESNYDDDEKQTLKIYIVCSYLLINLLIRKINTMRMVVSQWIGAIIISLGLFFKQTI